MRRKNVKAFYQATKSTKFNYNLTFQNYLYIKG